MVSNVYRCENILSEIKRHTEVIMRALYEYEIRLYGLCSLITDQEVLGCREVFTSYAKKMSGSVSAHIEKNRAEIKDSTNETRFDILFPDGNPVDTVDNCDLDLLDFLFNITCKRKTDDKNLRLQISVLNKLRNLGNEIRNLTNTTGLDERIFEEFWEKMEVTILEVGQYIPYLKEEIDKLRGNTIGSYKKAGLQECVDVLQQRATVAEGKLQNIASQMDEHQKMMKRMIESNKTDRDSSKDLGERVAVLEDLLYNKIDQLEDNQRTMQQMIDENITNTQALGRRVAGLENMIDSNRKETMERMNAMDRLLDRVMQLVIDPSMPLNASDMR